MAYNDYLPHKCPICAIGDLCIDHYLDLQRFTCHNPKCKAQFDLKWYPMKDDKKLLVLAQINPEILSELARANLRDDDIEGLKRYFAALVKQGVYTQYIPVRLV